MCTCVCVCMCVCVREPYKSCVGMCSGTRLYASVYVPGCVQKCMFMCMFIEIAVVLSVCIYAFMNVCHVDVCMSLCLCKYARDFCCISCVQQTRYSSGVFWLFG